MPSTPALLDAVLALASRVAAGPRALPGPVVVGLNGPQGCGKSTLAAAAVTRLSAEGRSAVALSIDDFYWPYDAQRALAARHPGNRYLEHRGYPGTHDVPLGSRTLAALRKAAAGDAVPLPAYDKAAHHGRGDRRPAPDWPRVRAPVEVVILEGWMLGFPPVPRWSIADRELATAAGMLPPYAAWVRQLDAFVHLEAVDPSLVIGWRVEAERNRRLAGSPSLSAEEARDYVERFLPAYALWGPALRASPPAREGATLPGFHAVLGADRAPVAPPELRG